MTQKTAALPHTMTAWQRETYGSAGGTHLARIPVPTPGRGEVLLKVRATTLNAADVRILLGDPLLVRPVFGLRRPKQPVRGIDVAATVVAMGPDATGVTRGDEVIVELPGGGGLAPYAVAPAERLVKRPATLAPEAAACLPIAGGTAWQALDLAGVDEQTGRVLILGASGGVGTFAVQLAALHGAEVWATCGERNRPLVEGLGAVRTFDHRTSPLDDLPSDHFDAVIDIAGGVSLRALQRLVAPGGTVVLVVGDGGHVLGPVPRMIRAAFLSIGSRRRIRPLAATAKREIVRQLAALAADGRIAPVIEREWPFEEASAALAHVEGGHAVGKVVVRGAASAE
ncbi:NADPH:quinone reductase-like Zn-dependent oxidoreductase [Microbacterium keratanolyticum]|uniref:NADPH:quinone reductase n=1 Tax=Microbacterium keratanolyticum TaxID=67574 RepID=A0A9W6HRQ7_9MICO|nr:NAD(P)-dependent alcohol dehydrogenase [Microbacterium keratanolyticum]MBM7469228.1 NADPH:quinone reductase-like Zn-dependent oxidoreductase [Microbacterium keratanolyticum]GLK01308.1 NADPH:quinone reductase [Microbacterium keratanolyticum]